MSSLNRAVAVVIALVMALSGCAFRSSKQSSYQPAQTVNAPALPVSPLQPLADVDRDVRAEVTGFGANPSTVVAVGNVVGNVTVPMFRWSDDLGTTWHPGGLSEDAAKKTQIAERSLGLVAFANNRWVALGAKGDTLVAWTSANGRTWDRTEATGVDGNRAELNDITASGDGFVLVGALATTDGEHTIPYVWTSPDGVTWTAVEVTKARGTLNSIAVRDQTLVAVGKLPLDKTNDDGRYQYAAVFTSTDGGKSWTKAEVPEPSDSQEFYAELVTVVSAGTGFVAAGQYHAGNYRSYALTSADGITWTLAPELKATLSYGWTRDLLVVDNGVIVLTGETDEDESRAELHLYRLDQGGWTGVDLPKKLKSPNVTDALGVGPVALVGLTWQDPAAHAAVWRTTDAGQQWSEQASEAPVRFKARINPVGLVLAGGTELAYGDAQGFGVTWQRGPQGFSAPTVILDGDRRTMDGLATGPKSWLMWGQQDSHAWVAVSADQGTTWTASKTPTFSSASQYAWSLIREATWLGDRWLVVGSHSENGDARTSALAFTSTDGKAWQAGVPTRANVQGDDGFDGLPVVSDLDGVLAQQRQMAHVTGQDDEAIAVGWTTKDAVEYPAWWTSSGQGRTWKLQQPLPTPGVTSAIATQVSADGDRITILGMSEIPGSAVRMPCTWVSTDAGSTWTFAIRKDWGRANHVSLKENGKELIAVIGAYDRTATAVWRSKDDGTTWTKTPVEVPVQGQGVAVDVRSALVVDGELHLLIRVYNRLDGVSLVQTIPLT